MHDKYSVSLIKYKKIIYRKYYFIFKKIKHACNIICTSKIIYKAYNLSIEDNILTIILSTF